MRTIIRRSLWTVLVPLVVGLWIIVWASAALGLPWGLTAGLYLITISGGTATLYLLWPIMKRYRSLLRHLGIGAVLLAWAIMWASPGTVDAFHPPSLTLYEAHAYRCVIERTSSTGACDALVLVRYQLPTGTSATQWQADECADAANPHVAGNDRCMNDVTFVDQFDLEDTAYTSVIDGMATLALLNSAGTVVASRPIQRIGHGLAAVYFCMVGSSECTGQTASAVTFSDSVAWDTAQQVCLYGPSVFVPRPSSCTTNVHSHSSTSLSATSGEINEDLIDIMGSLEKAIGTRRLDLIESANITLTGAILIREAFSPLIVASPESFANAVVSDLVGAFAPTVGASNLRVSLTAPARSGARAVVYEAFQSWGTLMGMGSNGGLILGTFATLLGSLALFAFMVKTLGPSLGTGAWPVALAGGLGIWLLGGFLGLVAWAWIFVAIVLLVLVGMMPFFRERMPG